MEYFYSVVMTLVAPLLNLLNLAQSVKNNNVHFKKSIKMTRTET